MALYDAMFEQKYIDVKMTLSIVDHFFNGVEGVMVPPMLSSVI